MKFYTNIQLIGNQFLIRGYENGKHITHREEWKPTLFVPSKRKTKYKTLEGDSVEPIQPGFVRECREFYKKYDEVENFKIYGNDRYVYQYISEKYPITSLSDLISFTSAITSSPDFNITNLTVI